MFAHETNLLIWLANDILSDIIKRGIYVQIKDAINTLKCFEHSLILNINVNEIDKLNGTYLIYLKQLNSNGSNIELIPWAKYMLNQ